MTDTDHSPFEFELDPANGSLRRVRNTSRDTGVPLLPLETKLRQGFSAVAGGIQLAGDEFSYEAVRSQIDNLSYGWALLARENPHVHRFVSFLVETDAWVEAAIPTALVLIMIGWHYNLLPARLEGVGVKASIMAGVVPVSREQEREMHIRGAAQNEQKMKEEFERAQKEMLGANQNGREREHQSAPVNPESPSVSPIVDLDDDPDLPIN